MLLKEILSKKSNVRSIITNLGISFHRKPISWSDLKTSDVEVGELTYELDNNNLNIDILNFQEVYDDNDPKPSDNFNSQQPLSEVFAIEDDSGFFIIDTQGYDYARLIAKLED